MVRSLAYYATLLHKDFSRFCNQKLSALGLSPGQIYFLLYVGRHPECSPTELARALRMDDGHIARSIGKLARSGFLSQAPNPRDRRAHVLRLTEKGREAFALSHDLFAQWDHVALGSLTEAERQLLLDLLARLAREKEAHFV